jgi:hypothetical protein
MSADALLFVWGEPYATARDARRSAHWYDLGSSMELATYGNQYRNVGNRVDVSLVDGHVVGWVDDVPNDAESAWGFRWVRERHETAGHARGAQALEDPGHLDTAR